MNINSSEDRYYTYRIKLEKLKQKTWLLVIIARLLVLLAAILMK